MRNVLQEQFSSVIVYPTGKSKFRNSDNTSSDRIGKKGDNTVSGSGFDALLAASIKQLA